jgi:2-haloacid dehalogenase
VAIIVLSEGLWRMSRKITVLVFDVNETLLDIESLNPFFSRLFHDEHAMREWFSQLVLYSQAITLAGCYVSFSELAVGTLRMIGTIRNIQISEHDSEELKLGVRNLPAHPEVAGALSRLSEAGFRLVTLTNSPQSPHGNPLELSGLDRHFERMFSVHELHRFKPAPETYRYVAEAMDVELSAMCMVAAHTWDTLGAQALGCAGALITRPGNAPLPVEGVPQPDIVAGDLELMADEIIRRWS